MLVFVYEFLVGLCCGGRKDIKHLASDEYDDLVAHLKATRKTAANVLSIFPYSCYILEYLT